MKTNQIILLSLAVVGLATTAARAQVDFSAEIRLGHRPPPPPPAVVVVVPDSGPSPWAEAHWYQANQDYYYYPGADVYYRVTDHVWFYNDRGTWRNGPGLPPGISIDFGRAVPLRMATSKPYRYHAQIVARYPANYFETRVRFRDERHDDRRDDRKDDRRDDRRDDHDRR